MALEENDGVAFSTVRNSGDKYNRPLHVFTEVDTSNCNQRVAVSFIANVHRSHLHENLRDSGVASGLHSITLLRCRTAAGSRLVPLQLGCLAVVQIHLR